MTNLICRSDCQFSQNTDRICSLKLVELTQNGSDTPELNCGQYVKADKLSGNARMTDLDRARTAGLYAGLDKRLRNG